MSLPSHLSRNLRRRLGEDAGGDLVNWLDEMRAEHVQQRADIARAIEASESRLSQKMDDRFARVDERFAKVDERLAGLQVAISDSKADLMKWMLVFLVGAVAALAGVLRQ